MYLSLLFLSLPALAAARTDLSGCVSSETIAYGGASLLWYVPGTGEICEFLDCGGGRAPPATTVPGCPLYSGTATYSPSYLPSYKDGAASSTTYVSSTSTAPSTAMITGSQTTEAASQSTTSVISSSESSSVSKTPIEIVTSTTGTVTGSQSSSSGTTKSSSGSSTPSSSASASTATGNTSALTSVNTLFHGLVGVLAAGFAFLL